MSIPQFEQEFKEAISNGLVSGAALYAVDRNGKTLIEKAFGKAGVGNEAGDMTLDTTMWIASSTKLLTSVSILQLVERELISLDEPIARILPEFKSPQILLGFDEKTGEPILKPAIKVITLKHLLNHSSGLGYDIFNPVLMRYRNHLGWPPSDGSQNLKEKHVTVLLFEPGEGWQYSIGIDWAGEVIERITKTDLEDYMRTNIWERLGMRSTTFRPLDHPDIMKRMHGRVTRDKDGKLIKMPDDDKRFPIQRLGFDVGGGGLVSNTRDYAKVIRSLVMNDGVLLKKETVNNVLNQPSLEPEARQAMQKAVRNAHFGPIFAPGMRKARDSDRVWDHGVASALMMDEVEGENGKGMMHWGGLANNNWYMDFETGVAGFYGTWIIPPGDLPTGDLFGRFRMAVYEEVKNSGR